MWRQLVSFNRLKPHLLTWEYKNSAIFPLNGVPLHVLPFAPEPQNSNRITRWRYRLRNLPTGNFYASLGAEREAIEKVLTQTRAEVVLCQYGFMALRLLPLAQQLKIPLVAHFHGLDLSSSLRIRWYRWSLLRALNSFSAIVVVGSHQERWMLEHGVPANRIHLIPCGVPTDLFSPKVQKESKDIQFIAVSRMVEKKGLEYTISALAEVCRIFPGARLLIVGDGPLRAKLEALVAELSLTGNVTFAGLCTPEQTRLCLDQSDVFVQHSVVSSKGDMEGSSVSIAEGSAAALPVIATSKCGGTEEQVVDDRTGFLVSQRDVKAMAKRMLQLAGSEILRKDMGEAGREHMVREFDSKRQIAKLENVLLNCCSAGVSREPVFTGSKNDDY